jgi:hypothetical protein
VLRATQATRVDQIMEYFRGDGAAEVLSHLQNNGPCRVDELVRTLGQPADHVVRLVVWMAKFGVVAWK